MSGLVLSLGVCRGRGLRANQLAAQARLSTVRLAWSRQCSGVLGIQDKVWSQTTKAMAMPISRGAVSDKVVSYSSGKEDGHFDS